MAGRQGFLPSASAKFLILQHLCCKRLKLRRLPESIPSGLSLLLYTVRDKTDTKTHTTVAGRLETEATLVIGSCTRLHATHGTIAILALPGRRHSSPRVACLHHRNPGPLMASDRLR